MCFVVRYAHDIQLCDVQSTTGVQLENLVMHLLKDNQLKAEDIHGQGYDGAVKMSELYKGLQSRIHKQNEKAMYVHAHCLNLVLVESAKSSIHFVSFFFTELPNPQNNMQLLSKHSKSCILASVPLSYRSSPNGVAGKQPSGLSENATLQLSSSWKI